MSIETRVVVVGAGATGLSVASQLAAADIECVVLERKQPGAGATLRSAGVLHSGARYAVLDPSTAQLCASAQKEVLEFAGDTITCRTEAYYLILDNSDQPYAGRLLSACDALGITARRIDRDEVLTNEPMLRPSLVGAIAVPDYVQDPMLLVAGYQKFLIDSGVPILLDVSIEQVDTKGTSWLLHTRDTKAGDLTTVRSEAIVLAAGAWTPDLLRVFGVHFNMSYAKGSMFVSNGRFVNRVVCHCAPPNVPDTAIPCYETTLLGSTWRPQYNPDTPAPDDRELQETLDHLTPILPSLSHSDIDHGYSGGRVLVNEQTSLDAVLRDNAKHNYHLGDHNGPSAPSLISIFGGKLTLHYVMARAAVSMVCRKLSVQFEQPRPRLVIKHASAVPRVHLGSLRQSTPASGGYHDAGY